jgi:hypothetical protein
MTEDGSWDSIRERGLLSTSALLDLYDVDGERRVAIESRRRTDSVVIRSDGLAPVVIRDQKPIDEEKLRASLDEGLSPQDWYRILNARTFFWASRDRLLRLLRARAYRGRPQIVLTIDTESLVAAHGDRIELCRINSGSTLFSPPRRGRNTFLPLVDCPCESSLKTRRRENAIAEVVVRGGVPDLRDHVLKVYRVADGASQPIWLRDGV